MGTWPGWPLQRSRVWSERETGTKAQVTYPAGQRPRTRGETEGDLETIRDLHMGKETERGTETERQGGRDKHEKAGRQRSGNGHPRRMATWPNSPLAPGACLLQLLRGP